MMLEVKIVHENLDCRLWMYYRRFQVLMLEKKQDIMCEKKQLIASFLDKESKREQKIYSKLKGWERRHPIMGIVLCTILGGILVSLVASIIFEPILMSV